MNYVLVVDDEESIRLSIRRAMRLLAPELKLFTAPNGAAAVAMLELQSVDLVVTDLLMPQMDGFELLAWLSQNQPMTPAIVMTAMRNGGPDARINALGAGVVLQKPFDVKSLIEQIREVLGAATRGVIKGMSLGTFVQMVGMERKTCTLRISADRRRGSLAFMGGELIAAESGRTRGLEAALDVLSWDRASIEVVPSCRGQAREIEHSLEYLLIESCRLKDERPERVQALDLPAMPALEVAPAAPAAAASTLQERLRSLRQIDGYRGAAVVDESGALAASDAVDASVDLPAVCQSAGEIARGVCRSGKPAQVDGCQEIVVRSSKAILLLRCSSTAAGKHFHVLVLLKPDGNRALATVRLDAFVPEVAAWLA